MAYPRVTILLPVLDEATYIEACLASLAAQDYEGEIEVIVADGGSSDNTLDLIDGLRPALPLLRVVDNPQRVQSHGLNIAAEEASGEILIRADAHATYSPGYVRVSVETLLANDAAAVGGLQLATGNSPFQAAVAEAMSIPLAVGPARFRHAGELTSADTAYLGAFRKADFERIGGWRTFPSHVAEDADFYFRLRANGGTVLVDPRIESTYFARGSVGGLWRQYYRYGIGKADMLYINGRWPSWRPVAPLGLVLGLLATLVVGITWTWWPLLALLALWLGSLIVAARGRSLVVVAGGIMHLAYGLGLLRGLLRRPSSVRAAVT